MLINRKRRFFNEYDADDRPPGSGKEYINFLHEKDEETDNDKMMVAG